MVYFALYKLFRICQFCCCGCWNSCEVIIIYPCPDEFHEDHFDLCVPSSQCLLLTITTKHVWSLFRRMSSPLCWWFEFQLCRRFFSSGWNVIIEILHWFCVFKFLGIINPFGYSMVECFLTLQYEKGLDQYVWWFVSINSHI